MAIPVQTKKDPFYSFVLLKVLVETECNEKLELPKHDVSKRGGRRKKRLCGFSFTAARNHYLMNS